MNSRLSALVAEDRVAELGRVAGRRLVEGDSFARPRASTVELRLARPNEVTAVERLAQLDDAPALEGEVLLALVDGEAIAALSLRDRRVVANPFRWTQDAVALLRLRAEHLLGAPESLRRGRRVARLRLAA